MTACTDEEKIKDDLERISSVKDKNERLSWKRKMVKMQKMLEELAIIEDEMLKIFEEKKQPLYDEIQKLRYTMVKECTHPKEYLVHKGSYVECKFCNGKISLKNDLPS